MAFGFSRVAWVSLGCQGCPWDARAVPRVSGLSPGLSPGCEGCPQGVPMSLSPVPAVGALPHHVAEDGPALLVEEREAAHHPRPRGRHRPHPHHPPGHRHHPHLEPPSPWGHGHPRAQIQMGERDRGTCVCVCVCGVGDTEGHGGTPGGTQVVRWAWGHRRTWRDTGGHGEGHRGTWGDMGGHRW